MKKIFKGALVKDPKYGFRYQYTNIFGKKTTVTLYSPDGKKIFKKGDAEKAAFLVWQGVAEIDSIKTKAEAVRRMAEAKGLISRGTFKTTEVWDAFAKIPKNQNTRLSYRKSQWNNFLEFMNEKDINSLSDVTSDLAQAYMSGIKVNLKTATYNDYIITLRLIFKTVLKNAGLDENPFASVEKLAITDAKGHSTLTDEMIRKIVETVNSASYRCLIPRTLRRMEVPAQEIRILVQLGLCTGMRLKDAVLLSYDDIDLKQGLIKINTCKGIRHNKRVFIPIMPALKAVLDGNGRGYVMPTLARNYLTVGGYTAVDEIQHLFAQAGLPVNDRAYAVKGVKRTNSYGYHSFRHAFVSRCAAIGIPQAIVESIVGANAEVLKKYYTHISTDTIREAMKLLN